MSIKVTAENSQGIADVFDDWRLSLPLEKRGLVDAHIKALKGVYSLGEQSRCVLLAVIYLWYLEHDIEGRPMPKMWGEV